MLNFTKIRPVGAELFRATDGRTDMTKLMVAFHFLRTRQWRLLCAWCLACPTAYRPSLFWNFTQRSSVVSYRRFEPTYRSRLPRSSSPRGILLVPVDHLYFGLTSLSVLFRRADKQRLSVIANLAVMLQVVLMVHEHPVAVPVQATVFADFSMSLNLLKPTGHVMHHQFNLLEPTG